MGISKSTWMNLGDIRTLFSIDMEAFNDSHLRNITDEMIQAGLFPKMITTENWETEEFCAMLWKNLIALLKIHDLANPKSNME